MIREYFIYNIPLFFNQRRVASRLAMIYGYIKLDLFKPKKDSQIYHSGCARIESEVVIMIGEVDFGTRFPIFVQPWIDKAPKALKAEIEHIDNDEKTCSSDLDDAEDKCQVMQFSYETQRCNSIDIPHCSPMLKPDVVHSISLFPVATILAVQAQMSFNVQAYICDKCHISYCFNCLLAARHFNAYMGTISKFRFPIIFNGFKQRI